MSGSGRGAIAPLLRLARQRAEHDRRYAILLVIAVALPVSVGTLAAPAILSPTPFSAILVAVMAATVALSVGAVLATSTKRRVLRYGRLAAIGADPRHLRTLLVLESALPTAVGFLIGTATGLVTSLAIGPLRWVAEDDGVPNGDGRLDTVAAVAAASVVLMVVVTLAGLWFGAGPAAAMARRAPVEALAARAPEPEPRPFQGWVGAGIVVLCVGYAVTTVTFSFGILTLAVVGVFAGLHLLIAPSLVWLDRLTPRLPTPVALAARNAARNRTRFGRLTLASLAIVSLGVMGAAGILSDSPDNPASGRGWPLDERFVLLPDESIGTADEDLIRDTVVVADEVELALLTAGLVDLYDRTEYGYSIRGGEVAIAVATPELLAVLEPDDATVAAIERGALVRADGSSGELARQSPDGLGQALDEHTARLGFGTNAPANAGSSARIDSPMVLVSAERAAELSARPGVGYRLLVAEDALDDEQRRILGDGLTGPTLVSWSSDRVDAVAAHRVVIAIAAVFLAGFGFIGAALSGVETDEEVAALIANGADPSIRRWFRAVQSALQLVTAGAVGAPLGVLLFWAVTRTDRSVPEPIYPLTAILVLAVAVPLLVAAAVAAFTDDGEPAVSRRAMV
ncbi:MAG: FtsX-like permease family protein [Actinomycetota bacterium]